MKKTIKDFDIENKKVLIRCDLNVPIKDGKILDDNRIVKSLETIKYAIKNKAKVIVLSHLGRIKSEADKEKNTLLPVSKRMSELLGQDVKFCSETRGNVLKEMTDNLNQGEVLLIENTRYEDYPLKLESTNNEELAKYWASLGDIFINDAFGTIHRSHASNVGIASNLPCGIGFLVEREIKALGSVLNQPETPFTVILGGAKMADKIKVIDNLILKADYALLGGGIANTFLKAKGINIGNSVYDEQSIDHCLELLEKYEDKIILPVDGYCAANFDEKEDSVYFDINEVSNDMMILDIGPNTIKKYKRYINESKTIFWNGPVGVSEFKNFQYGTKELCELLKNSNAKVIVGGGDSASAAINLGYEKAFLHISTGGGASLEFIEGKKLPGIEVINDK